MTVTGAGLSRVASALPRGVEPVRDVLARAGCGRGEQRMFERFYGLRDSPVLTEGETMEDLLVAAGRAALDGSPAGLVLYGHTLLLAEQDLCDGFPDRLRARLGLPGARVYGLSHVNCTSVLHGLELADRYLHRAGASPDDAVLLLGGDQGSASDAARYIPGTTVSGDGAVGVVVRRPDAALPSRYRLLASAAARDVRFHRTRLDSAEEFAHYGQVCADLVVDVVEAAAAAAGLRAGELDHLLPHLSNRLFWRGFAERTGLPRERIRLDLLAERGHSFGADALMSAERAEELELLRPGDRCALVAIGQGAYFRSVIVEVLEER